MNIHYLRERPLLGRGNILREDNVRFFLTLRLLCLTVLVLRALLSSFLEEVLYKCSIWKSLDREAFAAALREKPLFKNLEDNDARTCSELFELYETTMAEQLEKFLPVHSIRTRHCPL